MQYNTELYYTKRYDAKILMQLRNWCQYDFDASFETTERIVDDI
jgi:hypothetical protein